MLKNVTGQSRIGHDCKLPTGRIGSLEGTLRACAAASVSAGLLLGLASPSLAVALSGQQGAAEAQVQGSAAEQSERQLEEAKLKLQKASEALAQAKLLAEEAQSGVKEAESADKSAKDAVSGQASLAEDARGKLAQAEKDLAAVTSASQEAEEQARADKRAYEELKAASPDATKEAVTVLEDRAKGSQGRADLDKRLLEDAERKLKDAQASDAEIDAKIAEGTQRQHEAEGRAKKAAEDIEGTRQELATQRKKLQDSSEADREAITAQESKIEKLRDELAATTGEVKVLSELKDGTDADVRRLELKVGGLEQEKAKSDATVERLGQELEEIRSRGEHDEEKEQQYEAALKARTDVGLKLRNTREELGQARGLQEELKGKLSALDQKRVGQEERVRAAEQELEGLRANGSGPSISARIKQLEEQLLKLQQDEADARIQAGKAKQEVEQLRQSKGGQGDVTGLQEAVKSARRAAEQSQRKADEDRAAHEALSSKLATIDAAAKKAEQSQRKAAGELEAVQKALVQKISMEQDLSTAMDELRDLQEAAASKAEALEGARGRLAAAQLRVEEATAQEASAREQLVEAQREYDRQHKNPMTPLAFRDPSAANRPNGFSYENGVLSMVEGRSKGLVLELEADFADFDGVAGAGVELDGTLLVRGRDYEASSGSVVIRLNASVLNALQAGDHSVSVKTAAGFGTQALRVQAAPAASQPNQGAQDVPAASSPSQAAATTTTTVVRRASAPKHMAKEQLPQTGDPLSSFAALLPLGLASLGGGAFLRRRR